MTDKPQAQEKLDTNQSRMAETVQGFSAADWRTAQTNRLDVQKLTDDQTSPEDKARLVAQLGAS